uniref:MULE transposase domain-containing protein n=1 Tax=Lactuca sativa TaxID=4236 RepID=A0A9R1WL66_LACSA|nr:hypothetical protein LSAT_V11C100000560 [Lactuca sativa]
MDRFYIGLKAICKGWTWFLVLLRDDLELDGRRGLVVTSYQDKDLHESVKDILPHVEHRQCARHIYANFRKSFTGLEYKKLFSATSMSCVEGDFKRRMETTKTCSEGKGSRIGDWKLGSWILKKEDENAEEHGMLPSPTQRVVLKDPDKIVSCHTRIFNVKHVVLSP